MLRSFRIRLIIAFLSLFAAVSVAVSFTGMMLREQQVRTIFDRELQLRAQIVLDAILKENQIDNEAVAAAVRGVSRSFYFRDFYVQVYNDQSRPVARSANLGRRIVRLARAFEDKSKDGMIIDGPIPPTVPEGEPARLRGLRVRFQGTDGHEYIAIIGADPEYISDTIRITRWLFVGGNLGGLAAAGAAAWFVTGAMARRLSELVDQIEEVGPEQLDRRIEIHDRDEIADLARHINAMLDRLKAGFDTQDRFIRDASHELKTPVATIQTEAQALLMTRDPSQADLLEFVQSTNNEMRRLGRLTEALLLLTREDEKMLLDRFTPLEITEAATAAIRHLSAMACDHQVQLTIESNHQHEDLMMVRCDPDLLEAMVSNLIRNAIRFSPRRGQVRIAVGASDEHVLVTVDDDGPGIPTDVLPRMFERYFATSQSRIRRGAGLGLAIASTVARLHGGDIRAENRPEGGARFIVSLPRFRQAA